MAWAHNKPYYQTSKTILGYLKQEHQVSRSTKLNPAKSIDETTIKLHQKPNDSIYTLTHSRNKAYMNLTGQFPYKSSRGNESILIAYQVDANAILVIPIESRQAQTIANAWTLLQIQFTQSSTAPTIWILDNETPSDL